MLEGLQHNPVNVDRTFILAGYTIPCNGTVVAWEICYQITSSPLPAMFNPGIWRVTEISDIAYYTLIQSNNVTYDPRGNYRDQFPCKRFSISESDQFTAPAGSVVGLYSGTGVQLLPTDSDNSITTYIANRNQTRVAKTDDVNYNIGIKVHLGKSSENITI